MPQPRQKKPQTSPMGTKTEGPKENSEQMQQKLTKPWPPPKQKTTKTTITHKKGTNC